MHRGSTDLLFAKIITTKKVIKIFAPQKADRKYCLYQCMPTNAMTNDELSLTNLVTSCNLDNIARTL
jgi:hypothetical protein